MKKDPECSPRVSDSPSLFAVLTMMLKALRTKLLTPVNATYSANKLRLLSLCSVASSPCCGVGEETVMSRVSERRLSQPNAIKVAPTQA